MQRLIRTMLLKKIGRTANRQGYSAFVVGGWVRDLLLGIRNFDLDIVIEGDAIQVGRALAGDLGGEIVAHKKFGTCTIVMKDGFKLDLASARKEVYKMPAALPTVEFSSLKNDLARRDFTINAIAISINRENFGQLIDIFGGRDDLLHERIKVLHEESFIDDPTRILRAVRFEQRLGFTIDSHTEKLILSAVKKNMFDKVGPQRLRDEIILILKEKAPFKALKRMAELHELKFIHPALRMDRGMAKLFIYIDRSCDWYERSVLHKKPVRKWIIYLTALLGRLSYGDISAICGRFVFCRRDRLALISYKKYGRRAARILSSRANILPSEIYSVLEPLPYEVVILLMASLTSRRACLARRRAVSRIKDFIQKYSQVRPKINGGDIKALGLEPGPRFKRILENILHKKIDGQLLTKRDELRYVKEIL